MKEQNILLPNEKVNFEHLALIYIYIYTSSVLVDSEHLSATRIGVLPSYSQHASDREAQSNSFIVGVNIIQIKILVVSNHGRLDIYRDLQDTGKGSDKREMPFNVNFSNCYTDIKKINSSIKCVGRK